MGSVRHPRKESLLRVPGMGRGYRGSLQPGDQAEMMALVARTGNRRRRNRLVSRVGGVGRGRELFGPCRVCGLCSLGLLVS